MSSGKQCVLSVHLSLMNQCGCLNFPQYEENYYTILFQQFFVPYCLSTKIADKGKIKTTISTVYVTYIFLKHNWSKIMQTSFSILDKLLMHLVNTGPGITNPYLRILSIEI